MNVGYLYIALIVVGVAVGIALVWFVIELVMTLRKTRKKVDEIHTQLTPTLNNIEQITTKIQPTLEKVDPLVERVSLTIDAANLELMRADQILENVNTISEGVANATTAVGNIASAPADLINKAGEKISSLIGGGKHKNIEEGHVAGHLVDAGEEPIKKAKKAIKSDIPDPYITIG